MDEMSYSGTEVHSKTSLVVPKLKEDGSNWVLYRKRLIDYICGQAGYQKHFTGRAKPPTPLTPIEKNDADKVDAYEDAMDEYIQKQSAIRSIILGSLPEKIQIRIINKNHVADLWSALCQLYEDQNAVMQAHLLSQLHRIQTPEGGDPLKTIVEVLQKSNDYAAAGGILKDQDAAAILINAIPSQSHPVIHPDSDD